MTNLKHKPIAARSDHRRRYVKLMDLFRQRFNCTAAEAFPICERIISDNDRLKDKVKELEGTISGLLERVRIQEDENKALTKQVGDLKAAPVDSAE